MGYRVEILYPNLPGRFLLGQYGNEKDAEQAISDHRRQFGAIFGYVVVAVHG